MKLIINKENDQEFYYLKVTDAKVHQTISIEKNKCALDSNGGILNVILELNKVQSSHIVQQLKVLSTQNSFLKIVDNQIVLTLKPSKVVSKTINDSMVNIDLDKDGNVVGIEVV